MCNDYTTTFNCTFGYWNGSRYFSARAALVLLIAPSGIEMAVREIYAQPFATFNCTFGYWNFKAIGLAAERHHLLIAPSGIEI